MTLPMIDIQTLRQNDYHGNNDGNACLICGKQIKPATPAAWVIVDESQTVILHPDDPTINDFCCGLSIDSSRELIVWPTGSLLCRPALLKT